MARKKKKMTKAAFIRGQRSTMSAGAVVEAAQDAGIALTEHYVHSVRSADKAKSSVRKPAKKKGATKNSGKSQPVSARAVAARTKRAMSKTFEQLRAEEPIAVDNIFTAVVLQIGIVKARRMLDELDRVVASALSLK